MISKLQVLKGVKAKQGFLLIYSKGRILVVIDCPYGVTFVGSGTILDKHTLVSGGASGNQLRQLAASMGYDVRTHMKHYCQWTDEAGLDAAFDAANAKLNESLTKRQ